jgi:hypothetical protein
MKNIFWEIKTQFLPHRKHIISLLQSPAGQLYKMWGFRGGDYEECSLLGYKNLVRTSQQTHEFSATKFSRLMLYKLWGVHGSDYEDSRILRCGAQYLL